MVDAVGTVFTPVAGGAPLLTEGLGEIVHGSPSVDATIDSQQVRLTTGTLPDDLLALLAADSRFDGLGEWDRKGVARSVQARVFDAVTDGRVDADQ